MRSPGLAVLLTFLLPGAGQAYCGRWLRGLAVLPFAVVASVLGRWLPGLGGALYLAAAWDAYQCAKSLNAAAPRGEEAPSPALLAAWLAVRALLLLPAGAACLVMTLFAAKSLVGLGRGATAALFFLHGATTLACAALATWVCGEGLWTTYRVSRGEERLPPAAMRRWLGEAAALSGVAVLLLLIVLPYFSGLPRKSAEGKMRGDLGLLRAALETRRVREGSFPAGLHVLGPADGLDALPELWPLFSGTPHERSAEAEDFESFSPRDTGRWGYVSRPLDADFGRVFIDCTHTDTRGSSWTSY